MKKLLLVVSTALFSMVNAQTEQGNFLISGATTFSFNHEQTSYKYKGENQKGPKITTYSISPSFAYFMANDLAIGLDLVSTTKIFVEEDFANGDWVRKNANFSIMPTATYFFHNESPVLPYLGMGLGYGYTKNTETFMNNTESDTYDGFVWRGKGGIVWLVRPNIGLDLGVGFRQFRGKYDGYTEKVDFVENNFGVNMGISLFLGKKKINSENSKK